jgi:uncharacterized lipoprotein YbaY
VSSGGASKSKLARELPALLVGVALLAGAACGPRAAPRATVAATSAGPPAPTAAVLAGGWVRPIRSAATPGEEGFVLRPDGTLRLLGIYSMSGVSWRIDGDRLVLATNTDRYPEPRESRLRVEEVVNGRLVLGGAVDYLAGTWKRRAMARVTGTVTYRRRIALGPEAVVDVQLLDVTRRDAAAELVAREMLRHPGQVPIPFQLDYDPSRVDPRHTYLVRAQVVERGELRFVTHTAVPVITRGRPSDVEIVVVPAR